MAFVPPAWFASVPWATQEDETDPSSAFVEIRPGELDCTTTALTRLWYEGLGGAEWERLLTLTGDLWQVLENGIGSINEARYVSTAEGDVLEEIGAIVNRPRQGLTDELYRLAIRAEAGSIFASGTVPEILELVRSLMGDAHVYELFPATLLIQSPDVKTAVFLVLLDILADVPPAGVGALLSTYDSTIVFGYGSTTGGTGTVGLYDSTTGGADEVPFYATGQPIGGE